MKIEPHSCGRRGFALVLSLGLMSLMLLLGLSLSALISVESQHVRQTRDAALARQNAYVSALLGLAQLQQCAGPDQRVSARADILDTGGSTLSAQANPLWTGVWATADADFAARTLSRYTSGGGKDPEAVRQAALCWLVSGYSATRRATPTDTPEPGRWTWLVGPNSVSRPADRVQAPLMEIISDGGGSGQYAWWTSDEGLKGNIAHEQPPLSTLSLWQYQQYPLKSGGEILRRGGTISGPALVGGFSEPARRGALRALAQLNLLEGSAQDASREIFHDVTTDSRGLMANVKNGGLRKDLADASHIPYADETPLIDPALASASTPPVTWGQLKSFLRIGATLSAGADGSASISVMPQAPNQKLPNVYQHGVYPVVVRLGTHCDAAFVERENGIYGIRLYFFPVIALWNPYDTALRPAQYAIAQWSNTENRKLQFAVGRWDAAGRWQHKPMLGVNARGVQAEDPRPRVYTVDYSLITNTSAGDGMNFKYLIDNPDGISPGEVIVFTATSTRPYTKNIRDNVLQRGFRPGAGFYIDLFPEKAASATASGFTYYAPYQFKSEADFPVEQCRIDLGVMSSKNTQNPDFVNEWWYLGNLSSDNEILMTIAGLNRAGLAHSIPASSASYGPDTWEYAQDGRPKAFLPTIRGLDDTRPMPAGKIMGENAQNNLDDFPAYGVLFELKNAVNDQNADTGEFRRRWLANFNPRGAKSHLLAKLGGRVGQINQNYIGHLRARGEDLNDSQSDMHYAPATYGRDASGGYFGYSTQAGPQKTVLFHLLRPGAPLAGVGDLMHMNPSSYFEHNNGSYQSSHMTPAYAVGNSLADPHLPEDRLFCDYPAGSDTVRLYDYSYLLNDALWDGFFSSTDPLDGSGPRDRRFVPAASARLTATYSGGETSYDYAAARWMQEGVFNVNSTSENAWRMLLASTFDTPVAAPGGDTQAVFARAPFLRTGLSFGGVFDGDGEKDANAYQGLRALSEAEIAELSRAIVRQVKQRGPFYSLAGFVNRTLEANAPKDFRRKGPLQGAIDEADLNAAFTQSVSADSATTNDPLGNYPNSDALYGAVGEGVPGFLTQADVLQRIGNRLSARSDTFKIRAYGEFSQNGEPPARAWCEILVQRTADYVNPQADTPAVFPPTDPLNKAFGRRFVILSLRWLSPDEI